MRHFYNRAEMRKHTNDKPDLIDADYKKAAHLAALVAPYRHAVLPEDSAPWAKELPSPTSHSNRSLQTEVSVAGKRNFHGGDKKAETALEIQGRRRRDKISLGNPVDSGLIAGFGEISVRARMRGGAERTRTACQARSRYRTGLPRVSPPRQFCDRMSLSDNIIQKGLAFGRHWSGTVR